MDFLKLKQLRGSDIWKHQVKSLKTPTLRVHGFIIGRILQSDIFRRGEVGWLHSEFYVRSQKRKEQLSEVHFFMFPSNKHVSAGSKMKGYWINWKLDLSPQL